MSWFFLHFIIRFSMDALTLYIWGYWVVKTWHCQVFKGRSTSGFFDRVQCVLFSFYLCMPRFRHWLTTKRTSSSRPSCSKSMTSCTRSLLLGYVYAFKLFSLIEISSGSPFLPFNDRSYTWHLLCLSVCLSVRPRSTILYSCYKDWCTQYRKW